MKVSVIIPGWGDTPHLGEMRRSLAAQTFRDYELILCQPPEGNVNAGAARNIGLASASGDWIYFADADDRMRPVLLEKAVACGEAAEADIVVFNAEEFDDVTGWLTPYPLNLDAKGDDSRFTSFGNCVWNKLFKREYIVSNGIRFQEQMRSNDLAFTVEALARTDRISVLEETLYEYRINNPKSLQSGKLADKTDYAALALVESGRRLESCGLSVRFAAAFERLRVDIASNNRRGFAARVISSVRNRGLLGFLKHSIGKIARRFS